MHSDYAILWYRLKGSDRFLIAASGESDRVVVDTEGMVIAFRTLRHLQDHAARHGIVLPTNDRSIRHDLDALRRWLARPRRSRVDCDAFLMAWNLFADVARSVGATSFDADQRQTTRLYEKLFWGANLPALTPPGRRYVPIWSQREVRRLNATLGAGLQLFQQVVRLDP